MESKFQIKSDFEVIDGKVYLVLRQLVWGEELVEKREVTDSITLIYNKYLTQILCMENHKISDGLIQYVEKDEKY